MRIGITKEETTILKGIAILTVILTHANGWARAFDNIPILGSGKFTSLLCQGGMTLFLFLSGYGLYSSYLEKGLKEFWDKKVSKILVPAVIIQVLWFVVLSTMNKQNPISKLQEDSTVYLDLACLNPTNAIDGTMWYLSYLFFCYFCFFVISKLFSKKTNAWMILIFNLVTFPMMVAVWNDGWYCACAFAFGVLYAFGTNYFDEVPKNVVIIIEIISLCLAATYYLFWFRKSTILDNIGSCIVALAIMLVVKLIGQNRLAAFRKYGECSFYSFLLEEKLIFDWIDYGKFSSNVRLLIFAALFVLVTLISMLIVYFPKRVRV